MKQTIGEFEKNIVSSTESLLKKVNLKLDRAEVIVPEIKIYVAIIEYLNTCKIYATNWIV